MHAATITDLMHDLDRPAPTFSREMDSLRSSEVNSSRVLNDLRRDVAEVEETVAHWIRVAELHARVLVDDLNSGQINDDDVASLRASMSGMEDSLKGDARRFKREQKEVVLVLKSARSKPPQEVQEVRALCRRFLAAAAAQGRAKAELIFLVHSVIAEADPAAGTGPVFEDPKELGAYLRAAIAG